MRHLQHARLWCYLLPLTTGCQLWLGEYSVDRQDPVGTDQLCEVERSVFDTPFEAQSDAQLATLDDYYAEANPELVERFDTVSRDFANAASTRSATYLMGEAGAGKSFIMRRIEDVFPKELTCDLSLAAVLGAPSDVLPTKRLPDLATIDESVVLNSLPGFVDPGAFSMPDFLEDRGCVRDGKVTPLILLDGVDEIHTTSAHALLRALESFLLTGGEDFVHVVVSGRPEGFAPWFADPMRGETTGEIVELVRLQTPEYVTRGDVSFRLTEYLDFAMQLEDVEAAGELDEYLDSVTDALEEYPFLRYSLSNLAVGNVVLQHTAPGMDESEYTLKTKIFEDLLARDAETHGRPGTGSRYDGTYRDVLERVAAQYSDVSAKGEFTVSPNASVELFDAAGKSLGEVLVTAVLERSGLAYLSSPSSTTKRFRFSPFWVHGYLAERNNQATAPNYTFQGCK